MEDRKKALLSQIIEEYVTNAEPVGSKAIVDKYDWEVSPATIRNEMSALEEEGYMDHPHTSAGRKPTEQGYRWYVESFNHEQCGLPARLESKLSSVLDQHANSESQGRIKQLAKAVAEIAENAVVVGFGKNDAYYTGLSYLFSQPEFENVELVKSFSEILDHLDEALKDVFGSDKGAVMIGSENPFGTECSFVSERLSALDSIFGILGPIRMDYKRNIGLVKWVRENV